jgi:hypothetical protein
VNSKAEIGSTKILSIGGIYAENSSVRIKPFTTIDAINDGFSKGGNELQLVANPGNKFALQGINSFFQTPDLSGGTGGTSGTGQNGIDPITKRNIPKFSGVGDIGLIGSKLVGTLDTIATLKAGFEIYVDTSSVADVVYDEPAVKE